MSNPLEQLRSILKEDEGGMSQITDKALSFLFANDMRRILGTSILNSEARGWAIGLPIIGKLIVERFSMNDDYIDRNDEINKLILTSTIAEGGTARQQLIDMLKNTTNILSMTELEKEKRSIK